MNNPLYKPLTQEELNHIDALCNKWLPLKNNDTQTNQLNYLYAYLRTIDFKDVIKSFTLRLKTVPWKFSKSEQVSGSICFFGGVVTSLLNYGYIEEIEGLFTFAVCYMLIDHFIDDINNSCESKEQCVKDIYDFIATGNHNNNRLICAASERYNDLLRRKPHCKQYFIKLFQAEINGMRVQVKSNLTRNEYLKASDEKGGLTSLCIASIIGLNCNDPDNFNLGTLIQAVDDLLDVEDDRASDIYTLVQYDIDNGSLDQYIYTVMKSIDELSNTYNIFKIILMSGIILGVHDNPDCVTESLQTILNKYNIYSDTTKANLINWFYDKLYEYVGEIDVSFK